MTIASVLIRNDIAARRLRLLAAAALYGGICAVLFSGLLDDLSDEAVGAYWLLMLVAAIGVGLVGSTWWALLVVVVPLVLAGGLGWEDRVGEAGIVVLLFALLVLLLVAIGVAVGRRTRNRALLVGAVLLSLPLPILVAAAYRQFVPLDRKPAHPQVVALPQGAFRGLRLGGPVARAQALFGPPPSTDLEDGAHQWWIYPRQDLTVTFDHGRINDLMIDDPEAQTPLGVGIGDNAAIARRRYPQVFCNHDDDGGDSECAGLFGQTAVFFWGDPIYRIELSLDTCWPTLGSDVDEYGGNAAHDRAVRAFTGKRCLLPYE